MLAKEIPDIIRGKKKTTPKVMEFAGYSPLMLAVAGSDYNRKCILVLIANGADINCLDKYDNNLFHIAALYGNNKILEFLVKNLKLSILTKNKNGETPLNICHRTGNKVGLAVIEKSISDSFIKEIDREEEQA